MQTYNLSLNFRISTSNICPTNGICHNGDSKNMEKMALMTSKILKEILGHPQTLRDMKYSSM